MIARPARVRIRSRKPWVLDRRRLFGWNVRLLTGDSYCTTSAVACPPADGHARGAGRGGVERTPVDPRKLVSCDNDRQAGEDLRRAAALSQTPTSIAEDRPAPGTARGADVPGCTTGLRTAPRHAVAAPVETRSDAPVNVRRSLPGCG